MSLVSLQQGVNHKVAATATDFIDQLELEHILTELQTANKVSVDRCVCVCVCVCVVASEGLASG